MFTISEKQFNAILSIFADAPAIFGVSNVTIVCGPIELSAQNPEHRKIVQKIVEKYNL